jgi:glycosyltransferase involved in cell wall biosynthesis
MASVDVAIPCYQYGRFLRECVSSVLGQGIADIRVIIIDNASTDNSVEVARQLAAEDARVEVVTHRTNLGPQASFNEGVDWAASDYFIVLCADDLLAPGCLARAIGVMERRPDVSLAIGTDVELTDVQDLPIIEPRAAGVRWTILAGNEFIEARCRTYPAFSYASATLVRTSAQKRAGHYRSDLPYTNDLEMLLRLALLGPVAETSAVQGMRRSHASNMSKLDHQTRTQELGHRAAAFESFFANEGRAMPDARRLSGLAKRSLAARAYWWGMRALSRGDLTSALQLFRFAFGMRPTSVILPPVSYLFATRRRFG